MRVAIIHDYLTQLGGAERVLDALTEAFPYAPIFTLLHDRASISRVTSHFNNRRITTSFLQRIPGAVGRHRYFPLLMPLAVEQFDLRHYDVVFSAAHSFAKGVLTGPHTLHISYCFTPTRYLWDDSHRYVREFSRTTLLQRLAPAGLSYIRLWDYYAAQRPDHYLTLSHVVAKRIAKYYRRPATVIPPPVDVEKFSRAATPDDAGYYLIVSRLVPYKRIDLAIAACEELGRPLKIVGTGPERSLLQSQAGPHTQFLGFVPDADLPHVYAGARALLFPQEEDFGITPLEAAAAGIPTIAYGAGGALETISDRRTGLFFHEQTSRALAAAIEEFENLHFDPHLIKQHATSFRREEFLRKMKQTVHDLWMQHQQTYQVRPTLP